jgi:hypothetical protein
MAEEYQGLLANERLRVAEEAANRTRGRGGVFLAAKGAERMRQGTRSMLGIEEPVVAEAKAKAAKDAKLQSILSKYPNMQTRADYQKAINELYINGYTEHANSILNLMKELPQTNVKPETFKSNTGTRYLTSGTFNGVNYTAGDLVPGETETVIEEKERKMKKVNGVWRYTDNAQEKVFASENAPEDAKAQASELYNTWLAANPDSFNTPEGKIELAKLLVQKNLAGTQVFETLMTSIDKDGANAIQQENLTVKAVERLSENYIDAGIGQMDTTLRPLESLINEYMPALTTTDGEYIYDGAGNIMRNTEKGIPGWGFFSAYQKYVGNSETVARAQDFAAKAQLLINTIIKERSGSAVSRDEAVRLEGEYIQGFKNASSFANWVTAVRNLVEETRKQTVAGYEPEVVYRYFTQQGIYPTLYNPDAQLEHIPVGAKFYTIDGQLREKTED